jgi:Zn-finger domain-containing protein
MSSLKEEANFIAFQCFLERLSSSSKTLTNKVDNNIVVQEVAIDILQLDIIKTTKMQNISVEGLQSIIVRIAKVEESNIESFTIKTS